MANLKLFQYFKRNNQVLVETGTWTCDGINKALIAGYQKVYSCDIDETLVKNAKAAYPGDNVTVVHGPSSVSLKEIMSKINEPSVIFLDGHVMPKDSENESLGFDERQSQLAVEKNVTHCPVMEELDIIDSHPIKTHTILIDDFHCFNTWMFDGLTYDDTIKRILKINPDYKYQVIDNVACFYIV